MMKNLVFIIISLVVRISILSGQTFITYETHAIQAGYVHRTQKIENVNEGMYGDNCFWDFSKLVCGEISKTPILNANESPDYRLMENSNLVIGQTEDQFFFNEKNDHLEYIGYTAKDVVITFDKPIVRMKYPFSFNDKFEGTFSGSGIHYGSVHTSITGSYLVEADGKGTMLLPNGKSINKAFRVKSIENFREEACNTVEWTITKYLWYTIDYRYPVFSIVNTEMRDDEKVTISHHAYYNEQAVTIKSSQMDGFIAEMKLSVFPNPTNDKINIKYYVPEEQNVNVLLFSISGTKIKEIVVNQMQKGYYKYEFSALKSGISPGVYIVNFIFGEKSVTKKIILED